MTDLRTREVGPESVDGPRGVEVVLDGSKGEVAVSRYVQALTDTVWLLSAIDRFAEIHAPRLRWTIADTSANGVLRAKLTPFTIPANRSLGSVAVPPRALVDGLQALTERAEIPDLFTERSMQRVDRLGKPAEGLRGVMVAPISQSGEVGEPVAITETVRRHAKESISASESTVGSVSGVLDVLNARKKRGVQASIYNVRTRHAVTCVFPAERAQEFVDAFGRRVLVGGTITRNELGQIIRIAADQLQILEDVPVPRVSQLIGIDPGWTGQLTTDEYLSRVRGA